MKITLNTTWGDVTREIRSDGTNEQRALCDLANAELDELEGTVDEFQSFVNASKWNTLEEALTDHEVFTDFMDLQNFTEAEDFTSHFNAMKFELDFMRLFFKCQ
jgi:CHASE1-domain containing sensor protein